MLKERRETGDRKAPKGIRDPQAPKETLALDPAPVPGLRGIEDRREKKGSRAAQALAIPAQRVSVEPRGLRGPVALQDRLPKWCDSGTARWCSRWPDQLDLQVLRVLMEQQGLQELMGSQAIQERMAKQVLLDLQVSQEFQEPLELKARRENVEKVHLDPGVLPALLALLDQALVIGLLSSTWKVQDSQIWTGSGVFMVFQVLQDLLDHPDLLVHQWH